MIKNTEYTFNVCETWAISGTWQTANLTKWFKRATVALGMIWASADISMIMNADSDTWKYRNRIFVRALQARSWNMLGEWEVSLHLLHPHVQLVKGRDGGITLWVWPSWELPPETQILASVAGTGCNFSLLVKKREKERDGQTGLRSESQCWLWGSPGHCCVGAVVTKHDCALAQGLYELHLSHTLSSVNLRFLIWVRLC